MNSKIDTHMYILSIITETRTYALVFIMYSHTSSGILFENTCKKSASLQNSCSNKIIISMNIKTDTHMYILSIITQTRTYALVFIMYSHTPSGILFENTCKKYASNACKIAAQIKSL